MTDQIATSIEVPTASDVRQALRYLARKGAYAVQVADDAASFAIHVEERAEVLAFVPAAIAAQARSRGWLERDQQGHLRLASAGLKVLRKVLSQPTAAGVGPRPDWW